MASIAMLGKNFEALKQMKELTKGSLTFLADMYVQEGGGVAKPISAKKM